MSAVAVEWEVFQDALKEAEDSLEIFQAEAHGTRHAERSDAAKQSVKTAMQQAKAVDAAIMEVRSAEERAVWKRKILQGKKAVKSIETQAAQLDRLSAKKTKLFEGAPGEEEMEEGDPRARAENTARKLLGQNQSVQRSEMIALESERIGLGTVGTLRSNRDTMLRTIDRTEELRQETTRSRSLITNIKKVLVYGKLTQILIILVLTLGIILVVYFRWIHKDSTGKTPVQPPPAHPLAPHTPAPPM